METMNQIFDVAKFILTWFWWAILLVWLLIAKWRMSKWPVEAVIIEKRGNNLIKTNDRAGRYSDPYTNITGYKLQKCKDTIPILNYDWVLHNVFVPTSILERLVSFLRGNIGTIFLFRYGSKQYKPIKINDNGQVKMIYETVKDSSGNDMVVQMYQPFDPRDKLGALDFEVIDWDNMNFMVQEQRASIERRKRQGEFLKSVVIPLAALAVSVILCIIMIKFGYDYAVSLKPIAQVTETPKATAPNIPVISSLVPGQ